MRYPSLAVAAVVLVSSSIARGDDAAEAKALIARAIKATGAKDDGKPVLMTWKDTGTVNVNGMKLDYVADFAFRSPDALRFDMTAEFMNVKIKLKHVTSGDKSWDAMDGKVEEVTGEKKDHTKAMAYHLWVVSLAPLNHDKAFKLSTVVDKKVNDKQAAGVLVERKDRPVITLYFDKETGLLAKSEMNVKDEFQGWKEVLEEAYYEDWKEVAGRTMFTKYRIVRDGQPFIETKVSDMTMPEKLDAKLFEKP